MKTTSMARLVASYGALLFVVLLAALCFGAVIIAPQEYFQLLRGGDPVDLVIMHIRVLRVGAALLVGGALALSGSVLQRLLRNPLADPYVLGVSAGGTLAATAAVVFGLPALIFWIPVRVAYAFAGCMLTLGFMLLLKRRLRHIEDDYAIPVIGLILNAFYGALLMFVIAVARPEQGRQAYQLLVGSIEVLDTAQLLSVGIAVLALGAVLVRFSGAIHAMSFGDDIARTIGFDAGKIRRAVFVAVALLIALVVSLSGAVGFVGLIVPHLARRLHGYSIRREWTASVFMGAILLVFADLVGRSVIAPAELPAGLFTALVGAPVLGAILVRRAGAHA